MTRNLAAYLEAVRARQALERAIEEDGATPAREAALRRAQHETRLAYAKLTRGEIGAARRALGGGA